MKKGAWGFCLPVLFAVASAEAVEAAAPRSAFAVPGIYLFILAVVALVVALIVVGFMRGKLNTAEFQSGAENYTREGSFDLRIEEDRFLYRTVERRKIEEKKE